MPDHYQTLGIDRSASPEEIKRAYRRLASQHHPDKGGDKTRFQQIQQAYSVLSDPTQRAHYDNPGPQFNFQGGPQGFDFQDIFGMFNQRAQHRRNHVRMSIWITLKDAAIGGKRMVTLSSVEGVSAVDISIPQAINDGDNVQYQGIGPSGSDLVVTFRIQPDPGWSREALDLTKEQKISIWDLIIGGEIATENIYGEEIIVNIPPRTQPGALLRLRGKGMRDSHGRQGDFYLRVSARIPEFINPVIVDCIQKHRQ